MRACAEEQTWVKRLHHLPERDSAVLVTIEVSEVVVEKLLCIGGHMVHEILAELVTAEVTAGVQVQVLEHASQKLDVFRRDRLRAD